MESNPIQTPKVRARWAIQLFVLASYVLAIGAHGLWSKNISHDPALPKNLKGLLLVGGFELCLFLLIFLIAIKISRATKEDLLLRWNGNIGPVLRGLLYSIALRFFVFVVLTAVVLVFVVIFRVHLQSIEKIGDAMKPDISRLIDPEAFQDPVYLGVMLTFMSFVVAGLREELWRVGMMSAVRKLFPTFYSSNLGAMICIAGIGVVFGFGHVSQGWGGVVVTSVLGFGLGFIIWKSSSCWEAILAHGFFDATSFMALYFLSNHF